MASIQELMSLIAAGAQAQSNAKPSYEQQMYMPSSIAQERAQTDQTVADAGQEMSSMHDAWTGMKDPLAQLAARIGQLNAIGSQYGSLRGRSPAANSAIGKYASAQAAPLQKLLDSYMRQGNLKEAQTPSMAKPQRKSSGIPGARSASDISNSWTSLRAPERNDNMQMFFEGNMQPPRPQNIHRSPLQDAAIRFALQYLNKRNPHRISSL